MSATLFPADILFLQRILASSGFYKSPLNGKLTDEVDSAQEAFLAKSEQIKRDENRVSSSKERMMRYALYVLAAALVFGGLFFGVHFMS